MPRVHSGECVDLPEQNHLGIVAPPNEATVYFFNEINFALLSKDEKHASIFLVFFHPDFIFA
jgi:hypothetical protein